MDKADMGNVVNLGKFRKEKAKSEKERKAAENRRKFGRTKAEKKAEKADADREAATHDGNELEASDDSPKDDKDPA